MRAAGAGVPATEPSKNVRSDQESAARVVSGERRRPARRLSSAAALTALGREFVASTRRGNPGRREGALTAHASSAGLAGTGNTILARAKAPAGGPQARHTASTPVAARSAAEGTGSSRCGYRSPQARRSRHRPREHERRAVEGRSGSRPISGETLSDAPRHEVRLADKRRLRAGAAPFAPAASPRAMP